MCVFWSLFVYGEAATVALFQDIQDLLQLAQQPLFLLLPQYRMRETELLEEGPTRTITDRPKSSRSI